MLKFYLIYEVNMKKYIIINIVLYLLFSSIIFATDYLTVPEKTDFKKTSSYNDVITFIKKLNVNYPDKMKIIYFATTTEGRKIPLVILSEEGISEPRETRVFNKPPVLIMANIHAGEIEGKEACQMMIREILVKGKAELLKNQTILIIPIFNCDGNEKMTSFNRRDNGPELAGERKNGQGYDLNRDYLKIESPEVKGLITEIFNKWDPVLFVDMHTTNGSYHQEPVTYAPNLAPEGDQTLTKYMWDVALPAIDRTLKTKYGVESIPYGNFIKRDEPSKGWRNGTNEGRFGTNYYGLRNRFSILNENYSHADYKTRVNGSFAFIRSILEFTSKNIEKMSNLIKKADLKSINSIQNSDFPIKVELMKTYDFIIKSYKFKKRKILDSERKRYPKKWYGDFLVEKTDKKKDYKTTLLASFKPVETIKLPAGYILLPSEISIARHLQTHGINVQIIKKSFKEKIKRYKVTKIESSKQPYQGHFLHKNIEFQEIFEEVEIKKGSFYVSLKQPLSRLIAYMLEPESRDGLIKWNFFDRVIVRQWRGYWFYPVYKILKTPKVEVDTFSN